MNELKPCPFCGSKKIKTEYVYLSPYIICCGCRAQTPCYNNYEEAEEAWNRRATDE